MITLEFHPVRTTSDTLRQVSVYKLVYRPNLVLCTEFS